MVSMVVATSSPVPAQSKRAENTQTYMVSEYVYGRLTRAQDLLAKERYAESREILDRLRERKGLNPHEMALVYQTSAYVQAALEHYAEAAADFEECLARNALPPAAELDIKYNLAQLYLADGQADKAAARLEEWFAEAEGPSSAAYYLLALAYFQQGERDRALKPARQAVESSAEPKEAWLQLLLSLYIDGESYLEAAGILERLLTRYPRKPYWLQLAAVLGRLGRDDEALAVTQLAYTQGVLSEDRELRNLARMYLDHELPYRAAQVLVKGIEEEQVHADAAAWKLLADSWLRAREYDRAVEPLARAARTSNDGDLYTRLGRVQMERERWSEAADALERALRADRLRHRGQTLLLLGITNQSRGRIPEAVQAFEDARKHDESRHAAEQWLRRLEQEEAQAADE